MHLPAFLHSVSYSGSWGQVRLGVDESVDKAANLGYDGVLLMAKRPHLSVLDYGPDQCARLRDRLAQHKLQVAIAGYNNFTGDWEHGEVPHFEIQVHYIAELARLARDLGGNLLRIFTGYEHPAAGYNEQWNRVVAAIKECSRRAAEFGVTIGVQNHHDLGVGFEAHHDLIQAVDEPNCKALFDAWAPALQGADLLQAAHKLAPLTAHTTVANYQRRPRYRYNPSLVNYDAQTPYVQAVPIDEGFIDYSGFLSALIRGGFSGSVAYEMCSPLQGGGSMENLDSYATRFLEFIDGFRGQAASAAD